MIHLHFPPGPDALWYEWPLWFGLIYCVAYTIIATVGSALTRRRVKRLRRQLLEQLQEVRERALAADDHPRHGGREHERNRGAHQD